MASYLRLRATEEQVLQSVPGVVHVKASNLTEGANCFPNLKIWETILQTTGVECVFFQGTVLAKRQNHLNWDSML